MPQLTALATSTSTWPKRMSTEFYSYFLDGSGKCIVRCSLTDSISLLAQGAVPFRMGRNPVSRELGVSVERPPVRIADD